MIEVRLLTFDEIIKEKEKLEYFMHMVLTENLSPKISKEVCEKYYEDIKTYFQDGSAVLLGAFDGCLLVGFHWGYERKTLSGMRMHSYFIVVEPTYRGKGIGKMFWKAFNAETKKRGLDTIDAMCTYTNKVAVNYHLEHGFEIERLQVIKKLT